MGADAGGVLGAHRNPTMKTTGSPQVADRPNPLEPMPPTEEPGTGEGDANDRRALIAEAA